MGVMEGNSGCRKKDCFISLAVLACGDWGKAPEVMWYGAEAWDSVGL